MPSLNDHWDVEPAAGRCAASCSVNGDKSVSHRSLLVGAVCDGPVRVRGFGGSADTLATLGAVRALGVQVDEGCRDGELHVHGAGLRGLREPDGVIDVHNSGTLLRLLPGLLAGQPAGALHARRRRVDPPPAGRPRRRCRCGEMGADVEATDGLPPLHRARPASR